MNGVKLVMAWLLQPLVRLYLRIRQEIGSEFIPSGLPQYQVRQGVPLVPLLKRVSMSATIPHCTNCAMKTGDTIVKKGKPMHRLTETLKSNTEVWVCPDCDHPRLIEIATMNFPPIS